MPIREFKIVKGALDQDDGLKASEMMKLGKIVLLAGPNGGGKTRILNRVRRVVEWLKTANPNIDQLQQEKKSLEQEIIGNPNHSQEANWRRRIDELEKMTVQYQAASNSVRLNRGSELPTIISLVPKSVSIEDPGNLTPNDSAARVAQLRRFTEGGPPGPGRVTVDTLASVCMAQVRDVVESYYHFTHPRQASAPATQKEEAIGDFDRLNEILQKTLGTKADKIDQNRISLFGRPFSIQELSDGQKILLQYAVEIFSQGKKLDDLLILLDEPENHIHPEILTYVFDQLVNLVTRGQIWVATHSLALAAHVPESSVFYVEAGMVEYAGNKPDAIVRGLVGDESEMADFLQRPDRLAVVRFSHECLSPQAPVDTGANDPQLGQIREAVLKAKSTERITLLDFGAGQARLFGAVSDLVYSGHINYFVYDKLIVTDATLCKKVNELLKPYDDAAGVTHIVKDIASDQKYDVVVLCNVLHEIETEQWPASLFSSIHSCMNDSGICLILEDLKIVHGELPNKHGFLLLYPDPAKLLFSYEELPIAFKEYRGDMERLVCYSVPRGILKNVTAISLKSALTKTNELARKQIGKIRSDPEESYSSGRLLAMWLQQLATATLGLESLGEYNSNTD